MPLLRNTVETLKHPLFLLVVGSIIGSFLIPRISEQTGKKRVLQEARLRRAVDIVDNNTQTTSQLNSLFTKLDTFHDDNVRLKPAPAKLEARQAKLVDDMGSLYQEFEKTGWWWYRSLNDEAVILELIPATGSETLRKHVNEYGTNISETVNALSRYWHACVAADYDFKGDRVSKIQKAEHETASNLFNARSQLVNNLVSDFTEPH